VKSLENTEEIVKRYEKYGRKVGWIVKWYAKYGRKLWNDMENMEENSEKIGKIWKIWKKSNLNSQMLWK
jgi:hypothetical protein